MEKERALAELLKVYMLSATCVECKLGRLATRRISYRDPCRVRPKVATSENHHEICLVEA